MLEQLLDTTTLLALCGISFSLYLVAAWINEHLEIKRLGGYAPRVRNYLPLGLDLVYRMLKSGHDHKDLDHWSWLFSWAPQSASKTVELNLGGQRFLFTADSENIKAVLATQFTEYGKGEPFHNDWQEFLGDSIFTTDGETWHNSRQLIRPQFIKTRVSDLHIFEKHCHKMLNQIGGKGQEVDISALFYRFTLDSATEFLLGKSVDSLDNPDAEFATAFGEVQRLQNMFSRAGPLVIKLLPRGQFRAGLKVINSFVNPYIERVLRLDQAELNEKSKSTEGYTFCHALASYTRDRKVIRDQLVAVLLAGRDTTAGTLSFTILELSRHPHAVAKLRREILERLGPHRAPTYEDLKNMPYLQHTINETMRLYPSVPFNMRMSLHDTTLPRGGGKDGLSPIGIKKNTPVSYSPLYMQRDPDSYAPIPPGWPDVGEFVPERWDGGWSPKPWTYIPFNGGPRICVGQQFANIEMGYTLVRILQRFERIEKYWADAEQTMKSEIVLSPGNTGVRVGFYAPL